MSHVRCFTAINLNEAIKSQWWERLRHLAADYPEIRWVPSNNWHLTLNFLGNVDLTTVQAVKSILYDVASRHRGFILKTSHLSMLPSLSRPRLVYLGFDEERDGPLHALQSDLHAQLAVHAIKLPDRDYLPHLTLGRIRREFSAKAQLRCDLRGWSLQGENIEVGAIDLMQSTVEARASSYTQLASALLQEPDGPSPT